MNSLKLVVKPSKDVIEGASKAEELFALFQCGFDTLRKPLWYNECMLEGKCPRCGCYYIGWALRSPRNQFCSNCGAALEITEDGKSIFQGYSPFTAEKYTIRSPAEVPPQANEVKNGRTPEK